MILFSWNRGNAEELRPKVSIFWGQPTVATATVNETLMISTSFHNRAIAQCCWFTRIRNIENWSPLLWRHFIFFFSLSTLSADCFAFLSFFLSFSLSLSLSYLKKREKRFILAPLRASLSLHFSSCFAGNIEEEDASFSVFSFWAHEKEREKAIKVLTATNPELHRSSSRNALL